MGKFRRLFLLVFLFALGLVIIILLGDLLFRNFYNFPKTVKYGVTFSPKYANDLRLDWKVIFVRMLDELNVRQMRIPTYWDVIEKEPLQYDFSATDYMLSEAYKKGAKVILVLGARQPRWPECHIPEYVKNLTVSARQKKILEFIRVTLEKYKSNPAIIAWEVENEPLLASYGQCDPPDKNFLATEVKLVRNLDSRPVILTDSGELQPWITPMKLSDIFGTTLYRTVYNQFFGLVDYPVLPYFYNIKSALVRAFFAPENKKTIIIELQAEPWSKSNHLVDTPVTEQQSLFSTDKFRDNINFGLQTGFDEIYLWGVEWWYFMEKNGESSYLDYAKMLFP